jgi:hypothetical protein
MAITPELKESGYWFSATHELMRRPYKEFEPLPKDKDVSINDFEIDLDEALKSGVFMSGGKGQAKTNLGMTIADQLLKNDITVKVFDISQAWKNFSIPKIVEIEENLSIDVNLYDSVVFDLSRLLPKDVKAFVSKVLAVEWKLQTEVPENERRQMVDVFEEVQMLVPQGYLRSEEAQYVLRLMTTGRNFKLGYIAIAQRPALTDTSVFELSFQRYFSRMDGENDLKKVANYIGDKAKQLENLRLGEFIYDKGNETKLKV